MSKECGFLRSVVKMVCCTFKRVFMNSFYLRLYQTSLKPDVWYKMSLRRSWLRLILIWTTFLLAKLFMSQSEVLTTIILAKPSIIDRFDSETVASESIIMRYIYAIHLCLSMPRKSTLNPDFWTNHPAAKEETDARMLATEAKPQAGRVRDGVENLIVHLNWFLVLSQRFPEEK